MPKQKLSKKAAADKKKRDLKRANRPDRKAKRAENQRLRRAAIKRAETLKV